MSDNNQSQTQSIPTPAVDPTKPIPAAAPSPAVLPPVKAEPAPSPAQKS